MNAPANNPRRGIELMLISAALFACVSACAKQLEHHYPVLQIVFLRCLIGIIPILAPLVLSSRLSTLRTRRVKGHFLRSSAGAISIISLFYTVQLMPLATASAFFFSGPLFVVLFSALLLKEKIGGRHWLAVIAGFIGVLIVLHPGHSGISVLGATLGIIDAIFYALAMLGVRALGSSEPPATIAFYYMLLSVLVLLPFQFVLWQMPDNFGDWLLIVAMGLIGGVGQLTMTRSYQYAPASLISPFNYSGLLWATVFGLMVWGEWPEMPVFGGGGIIVASGVYLARHSRKSHAAGKNQPPDSSLSISS